jgi:hypothetical protein
MKYFEKLLPNQPENSKLYFLSNISFEESVLGLAENVVKFDLPLQEHPDKSQAEMGSSIILQSILGFIVRSRGIQ